MENDSCSVDAVYAIAGCTFGKGNLVFRDYGKHVWKSINRDTREAIRVSLKRSINRELMDPEWSRLRKMTTSGSATTKDQQK